MKYHSPHGEEVGCPSSDGVTMKMPYGVDALNQPASHPTFPIGLVKTKSGFILTSVETGRLGIICYDR